MRIPGLRNGYSGLPNLEMGNPPTNSDEPAGNDNDNHASDRLLDLEQQEISNGEGQEIAGEENIEPPTEPPAYVDDGSSNGMEQMEMEDHFSFDTFATNENMPMKVGRIVKDFGYNVVVSVRTRIMDPLAQILIIIQEKSDYYLNKVGNPLILRRFFYIILMSMIAWMVMASGFMPSSSYTTPGGFFTDHELLIQYARQSMDLSKLERDLEYLSSMEHMSGTKGDSAVINYIEESMNANNLKVLKEFRYMTYSEYPTNNNTLQLIINDNDEEGKKIDILLSEKNFNPLTRRGNLENINIIYGFTGEREILDNLKSQGQMDSDFVLLLQYSSIPSEQIIIAQEFGAKAILFISEYDKDGDNGDLIQQRSVGLPQYGTGDILTPGYNGPLIDEIDISDAKSIPYVPIMPLSFNQGEIILKELDGKGIKFPDNKYSGGKDDLRINLRVSTVVRERQPVFDIIGKIEGREQDDKAIVISASRNSINFGARYPNFGTAALLSLVQICQEMKYRYDWKPLRNIYFISFGGSEFNYAGSTELIEERMTALRDEAYSFIDISQLGVWDNKARSINIQTHPLLNEFFKTIIPNHGFEITIEHIQQYGDWIPYIANGIPSAVLSNPQVKERKLPIDTKEDTFAKLTDQIRDPERGEIAQDLLLYVFDMALKLSDYPYIPFSITEFINTIEAVMNNFQDETDHRLNTGGFFDSLVVWKRIAFEWETWIRAWNRMVMMQDGIEPSLIAVRRWTWNRKLSNIGRRQLSLEGLPNRTFYKNVLFSPTFWTGKAGNGHWTFPGVRDAIDRNDWQAAQEQMDIVSQVMKQSAESFIEENNDGGVYK